MDVSSGGHGMNSNHRTKPSHVRSDAVVCYAGDTTATQHHMALIAAIEVEWSQANVS